MPAPAKATAAAPAVAPTSKKGKKAPLTEAQKAARIEARKMETPEARFKRLAKPRIAKALAALRRLETIGKSSAYKFSTEQANQVMAYLDQAVEAVRMAFVNRVADRKPDDISL